MPINHSFSITMCNFKLVAKLALFICIIIIIAIALLLGIIGPVLRGYISELQEDFPLKPESVVEHPLQSLKTLIVFFGNYISSHTYFVTIRIVYLFLLAMGLRFFAQLSMLPLAKILHSKMATGFDMGFLNAFISTIGENVLYSFISSVIYTVLDGLICIATVYLAVWATQTFGILGITVSIFIAIELITLRTTLFCQWLPEIVKSKKRNIFTALISSIKPMAGHFRKNFICMTVINVMFFGLCMTTALPTIGLIPILALPTYMVLYTALAQALNFSYFQQKYFIDNGATIYEPTKKF